MTEMTADQLTEIVAKHGMCLVPADYIERMRALEKKNEEFAALFFTGGLKEELVNASNDFMSLLEREQLPESIPKYLLPGLQRWAAICFRRVMAKVENQIARAPELVR
jgi:hypothetical protein